MEKALIYLFTAAAVLAVLSTALPQLKPQPDYCGEARRLAASALAVAQSRGWTVDTYTLDGVVINSTGFFHAGCGIAVKSATANSTALRGTVRLKIYWQSDSAAPEGRVALRRVP